MFGFLLKLLTTRETTPESVTPEVLAFCTEIEPGEQPLFLEPKPEPGAKPSYCFLNVHEKISRDGGDIQHGWIIWASGDEVLEAEFHAVWRTLSGELVDVTPPVDGEQRLLFLPSQNRTFTGTAIASVCKAVKDTDFAREFIKSKERIDKLLHRTHVAAVARRVGSNQRCPCGSGKKFKRCCGQFG